jgi:hypothetical protein
MIMDAATGTPVSNEVLVNELEEHLKEMKVLVVQLKKNVKTKPVKGTKKRKVAE